ncbi:hypothetical protein DW198_11610 [Bacteroides fragilis]|uniref:Uncharacterized protein n=1 Tax=Bacteroides fragilis TaxID=817 RepID=A0A0I9UJ42_BACFG|nr:hypothetical protein DW198_11610 [Bacteroides fragilis]
MEDETGRKRSLKRRQTEPPSQADRGSAGEKRSLCSHPPQPIPPKNKQEATENDLFQPIRTRFLERGRREGTFAESSPQSSTERHRVFVSF